VKTREGLVKKRIKMKSEGKLGVWDAVNRTSMEKRENRGAGKKEKAEGKKQPDRRYYLRSWDKVR